VPHVIPANDVNRSYLETKALRQGHLIDVAGREHLLEQIDRPVIAGVGSAERELVGSRDGVEAST